MKKSIKISIGIIGALVLSGAGFVVADYLALFGTTTSVKLAFAEARFRTTDKDTGNLIMGAGVRCFQKGNNNACTLRDSHQAGIVAVHMPYKRIVESSLLFTQNETIEKAADPKIHIMFIHNNYMKTTMTLLLDEIFANPGKEYSVQMKAPVSRDTDESE